MSTGHLSFAKSLRQAGTASRRMAASASTRARRSVAAPRRALRKRAQWWVRDGGLGEVERRPMLRRLAPWITVALVLAAWQVVAMTEAVPASLLPAPAEVAERFATVIADGRLLLHLRVTLGEVLAGLAAGVICGVLLGYAIAHLPLLEDFLSPIIVSLQSTPVVAYAPLLVIWFGSGPTSKIVTCALIVFFPMLMNTVVSVRTVPENLRDLMRVSGANRWQTVTKLELPAALPVLLTGLKTAATLAVIGAVVGEFIYAQAGLGVMIVVARSQYDTALVYVGVIVLAAMARALYGLVGLLERRLLAWQRYA